MNESNITPDGFRPLHDDGVQRAAAGVVVAMVVAATKHFIFSRSQA